MDFYATYYVRGVSLKGRGAPAFSGTSWWVGFCLLGGEFLSDTVPLCISSDSIKLSLGQRAGLLVVLGTSSSLALIGLGFPWSHSLFGPVAIQGEFAWDGVLHSSGYVPHRGVPVYIGSLFTVNLD